MFGGKKRIKEGDYVFSSKQDGKYRNIIFGAVSGIDGTQIGVNGLMVNAVGLKNKIEQGKAGERSVAILENPTPLNCIHAFIYRVEQENFTGVLDTKDYEVEKISPKVYGILDGWIRESLPELLNNVLSLPDGPERDEAKRTLKLKREALIEKDLRRNLYSVCRSLKILN